MEERNSPEALRQHLRRHEPGRRAKAGGVLRVAPALSGRRVGSLVGTRRAQEKYHKKRKKTTKIATFVVLWLARGRRTEPRKQTWATTVMCGLRAALASAAVWW